MFAALTMAVALAAAATHLTVTPWIGKDLETTTSAAAKFRLLVQGTPNTTISLQASGVASGWLAAFCMPTLCAPQRVAVTLPSSGQAVLQFELIREVDNAPKSSGARISGGGTSVAVPPATR